MSMSDSELVVLLDENWRAVGSAPKEQTHHYDTPLHLAFTAYVFDEAGRFLLSRRALTKRTWPGVWTNSFCGHPMPGELLEDAVRRRLKRELGTEAKRVDLVLGAVRYRAVMDNGMTENEVGPAVRVLLSGPPAPNRQEVAALRWVPWEELVHKVTHQPSDLSPWTVVTVAQLSRLGPDPWEWPVADAGELPPALRCQT